jgi:hypothetical protein
MPTYAAMVATVRRWFFVIRVTTESIRFPAPKGFMTQMPQPALGSALFFGELFYGLWRRQLGGEPSDLYGGGRMPDGQKRRILETNRLEARNVFDKKEVAHATQNSPGSRCERRSVAASIICRKR